MNLPYDAMPRCLGAPLPNPCGRKVSEPAKRTDGS